MMSDHFDKGYLGKVLLSIFDKVLLGLVVILLLTPVQNKMATVQKRHDKATQINDFIVDHAVATVDGLNKEVDDWSAAVRTKVRTGAPDNEPIIAARGRIDSKVAALSSYLETTQVTDAAKALTEGIDRVNALAIGGRLTVARDDPERNVQEVVNGVNLKAAKLSSAAIAACEARINTNVENAYAPPPR